MLERACADAANAASSAAAVKTRDSRCFVMIFPDACRFHVARAASLYARQTGPALCITSCADSRQAPSTPTPPSSDVLAALTIRSTVELRGVRVDRDGSSLVAHRR